MLDKNLHKADGPDASPIQRQAWISEVFGDRELLYISAIPTRDVGLASADISQRGKSLEALRRLMKSWPGAPQILLSAPPLSRVSNEEALVVPEKVIAKFYVETFVRRCRRAPVLPRCLPRRPAVS